MKQTASSKISNYENAKWYKGLDFRVLRAFHEGEVVRNQFAQTRREVATRLLLQASTMSGAVNRLMDKGYLTKCGKISCYVTGKTVQGVAVTEEGRQALQRGDFYS